MYSVKQLVAAGTVGLFAFASTGLAAPAFEKRQGTATNGWCTAHITQWQMNSEEHGTGGAYEIDLIVYDANGMFISGFNRGKASGSPGSLKLTALPSTLTMDFTGLDDDPIKMNYDGESWECPGDNCKMGAYDSGKREGDFGFTCKNLPEADDANVASS